MPLGGRAGAITDRSLQVAESNISGLKMGLDTCKRITLGAIKPKHGVAAEKEFSGHCGDWTRRIGVFRPLFAGYLRRIEFRVQTGLLNSDSCAGASARRPLRNSCWL